MIKTVKWMVLFGINRSSDYNLHYPNLVDWAIAWLTALSLSLYAMIFVICWYPLQTVWTQIRDDEMSALIWIQTVCHSDSVPERAFWFWKKSADVNKCMKNYPACKERERSGSVVECLTWDREASNSSLTGFTVLCLWARHIYPSLVLVQPRKTPSLHNWWKIVDGT